MIVAATERLGTIKRAAGANGALTIDPGFYSGGLDPNITGFTLPTAATTRPGAGSAKADGLSAGTYFIETIYNALGAKIATNEDTGLWRRFGVDANGNAVETRVYGSTADEAANLRADRHLRRVRRAQPRSRRRSPPRSQSIPTATAPTTRRSAR